MEKPQIGNESPKFSSPQEELVFLREQISQKESQLEAQNEPFDVAQARGIRGGDSEESNKNNEVISGTIREYAQSNSQEVLTQAHELVQHEVEKIALDLTPEEHDSTMNELLGILAEKGIRNTMSVVAKMKNSHIDDDFHRLLVEYLKEGHRVGGLKEKTRIFRALNMTLYEIIIPEGTVEDEKKNLEEIISSMEQFYASMLAVSADKSELKNYFTLEIAVQHFGESVSFYCSVPNNKTDLFEKTLTSLFYEFKAKKLKDDYNIFNERGESVGAHAKYSKQAIFPIKTYEEFNEDPLSVVLNTFSKLEKEGEGASIQFVFNPVGEKYTSLYRGALKKIEKGELVKEAIDIPMGLGSGIAKEVKGFFKKSKKKDDDKKEEKPDIKTSKQVSVDEIHKKIGSPILATNIRIVASAGTESRAKQILSDISSAFYQFENTMGNKIEFNQVKPRALSGFLHNFSFRLFEESETIPLNIAEMTTLVHFPTSLTHRTRELKEEKAGIAPAQLDLPQEGILLGVNEYRGKETNIYLTPHDRLRHLYIIGQTGTGKTTLIKNLIIQDINNGEGVCMIDPHGSDIQDILAHIPPERLDDVIYFDPAYTARPMGLNMLEYDPRYPEQKTFVVDEMLGIFNKLFDMKTAGGPMFEQYFRNSVLLVMDDIASGNTLLDVSRVLVDKKFRDMKLERSKNPIVVQYWREVAEKAGGEASLANIVPYITSKFDVFLSNEIMRPIIAQEKSSFNFREIMDNKKILLVNLSKGRLGDINANLLGLIIVGKLLMAALSRVDSLRDNPPPFYLYIDEFQNVTTDSIATILSEARKYNLALTIAHQFIAQLEENIKNAVFGNVGSIISYRISIDDAEYLEKQFAPVFNARDLMNVDNFNFYAKILANGRPVKPFSVRAGRSSGGNEENIEKIKELSYLKHGRPREEVEAEIMAKYQATKKTPDSSEGMVK